MTSVISRTHTHTHTHTQNQKEPTLTMSSASDLHLTIHEALSGVFGSISLASWIFLLVSAYKFSYVACLTNTRTQVPQLIENYTQGSAAGISLAFLSVWFIGDITNLSGALWAGLVPTVTALAVYFCFADLVLISQCLYYNIINSRRDRKLSQLSSGTEGSAEEPLLSRRRRSSIGLPGSHRRSSASRRESSLAGIVEEGTGRKAWIKNTVSISLVCLAGTAGWAIAWQSGVWKPQPELEDQVGGTPSPVGAQILGYASAICYLGARIPQIVKNQRDRSCEGLSLLFFLLSLLGNLTYGAGVSYYYSESYELRFKN